MSIITPRISLPALRELTARKLKALGFDPEETRCICDDAIRATGEGHVAHGVGSLYVLYCIKELRPGRGRMRVRRNKDGFITVSAPRYLGWQPAARAVELLTSSPAAALRPQVAVVRCRGFRGRLGHLTSAIAQAGLVGLALQATAPVLAVPGASRGSLGTNPLAISVPVRGGGHPPTADLALPGVSFATEFLRVVVSKRRQIMPLRRRRTPPETLATTILAQLFVSSLAETKLPPATDWGLVICTFPPRRSVGINELRQWKQQLGLDCLPGEHSAVTYAQALRNGVSLPKPIHSWLATPGR